MARIVTLMNWAQTRQRGILYACMSGAAAAVVLVGFLVPLLKSLYVAGNPKHMFQPMFIGLANLAATVIGAVWWVPGIPVWWAHASLPSTEQLTDPSNRYWVAWLGVAFIGAMFRRLSRRTFQTMRNAKQLAHEEHLKPGRLGPQKAVPPQHVVNVNARDIHESVIGNGSGANVAITSTHNDLNLPAVREFVNGMLTHIAELHLPASEHMQLRAQLSAIQREATSRTPNRPRLQNALHQLGHTLVLQLNLWARAPFVVPICGQALMPAAPQRPGQHPCHLLLHGKHEAPEEATPLAAPQWHPRPRPLLQAVRQRRVEPRDIFCQRCLGQVGCP